MWGQIIQSVQTWASVLSILFYYCEQSLIKRTHSIIQLEANVCTRAPSPCKPSYSNFFSPSFSFHPGTVRLPKALLSFLASWSPFTWFTLYSASIILILESGKMLNIWQKSYARCWANFSPSLLSQILAC